MINRLCRSLIKHFYMNRKIAIPIENGMLCPHFGHCEQFSIIETDNKTIVSEQLVTPPPHEPGLYPVWLAEKGVTDIIAGGMGQKAIAIFNNQKINVFTGAPVSKTKDLVNDFLNAELKLSANYCSHDHHGHGHHSH